MFLKPLYTLIHIKEKEDSMTQKVCETLGQTKFSRFFSAEPSTCHSGALYLSMHAEENGILTRRNWQLVYSFYREHSKLT